MREKKNVEEAREAARIAIEGMKARWPHKHLSRSDIKDFTGGVLDGRQHLTNADSQGIGPRNSFILGRRRCYLVDDFCDWMLETLVRTDLNIKDCGHEDQKKKAPSAATNEAKT